MSETTPVPTTNPVENIVNPKDLDTRSNIQDSDILIIIDENGKGYKTTALALKNYVTGG